MPADIRPLFVAILIWTAPAGAQSLAEAITSGTPLIDLRLRYDSVDQADKRETGEGAILRARLGYKTGAYEGFAGLVEIDTLQHLGAKHFNNSIDRLTQYPTISDPDMVALNRLELDYGARLFASGDALPDLMVVLGRQVIGFSDFRYIGNSAWRLHEQTYDAVSVVNTSLPETTLSYSYVLGVNRSTGPRSPTGYYGSNSHFLDAVYGGIPSVKLEGFAYLLDLKQAPTLSTATFGVRADAMFDLGSGVKLNAMGTAAHQTDYGRNPLSIGLGNYRAETGISQSGFSALAGYEVLEGNGTEGFQTPLGLAHPFQGWSETFSTKPPQGVKDAYIKASYSFPAMPLVSAIIPLLTYHDFSAQRVSADYGHEWDAGLEAQVDQHLTLDVAYADYKGAGPFPGKHELWTSATYHY